MLKYKNYEMIIIKNKRKLLIRYILEMSDIST
jgi:hypothetical protein